MERIIINLCSRGLCFNDLEQMHHVLENLRSLVFPPDRPAETETIHILETFLKDHLQMIRFQEPNQYVLTNVTKEGCKTETTYRLSKIIGQGGWNVAWETENGSVLKHYHVKYHKSVGRLLVGSFFENLINLLLTVWQDAEKIRIVTPIHHIAWDQRTKVSEPFEPIPDKVLEQISSPRDAKPFYQPNIMESRFMLSIGEKMDGDCQQLLWKKYSQERFRVISIQAFRALQYLQDTFQLVHNDFKLANLFYRRMDSDSETEILIGDFGASQMVWNGIKIYGSPDFTVRTGERQFWKDALYYFVKYMKDLWNSKLDNSTKQNGIRYVLCLLHATDPNNHLDYFYQGGKLPIFGFPKGTKVKDIIKWPDNPFQDSGRLRKIDIDLPGFLDTKFIIKTMSYETDCYRSYYAAYVATKMNYLRSVAEHSI